MWQFSGQALEVGGGSLEAVGGGGMKCNTTTQLQYPPPLQFGRSSYVGVIGQSEQEGVW